MITTSASAAAALRRLLPARASIRHVDTLDAEPAAATSRLRGDERRPRHRERAAARASATPCLPLERLPMKRTGSSGSRVPPAVTRIRVPREVLSRVDRRREGGRDDVVGLRHPPRAGVGAGQLADWPGRRRARRGPRSVAMLATVAAFCHISVCMAGAITSGRRAGEDRVARAGRRRARPRAWRWCSPSRERRRSGRRAWPRATCRTSATPS